MTAFDRDQALSLASQLEALDGQMTKGEWMADLDVFDSSEGIVACVSNAKTELLFTAGTVLGVDTTPLDAPWTLERAAKRNDEYAQARESQELRDATGIASARNALPTIAATLRAAITEISTLEARRVHVEARTKEIIDERDVAIFRATEAIAAERMRVVVARVVSRGMHHRTPDRDTFLRNDIEILKMLAALTPAAKGDGDE